MSVHSPSNDELRASFDPKLKIYLVIYVAFIMLSTFVGALALPLWLLVGPFWAVRYFSTIQARLTSRSLVFCHGVWFRQEMSIPLDKIQDVSLHHGPFLDALGLATLKVDTAGGGQAGASAKLIGVTHAEAFRSAIIQRRDSLVQPTAAGVDESTSLLMDIHQTLLNIEKAISQR